MYCLNKLADSKNQYIITNRLNTKSNYLENFNENKVTEYTCTYLYVRVHKGLKISNIFLITKIKTC